MSPPSCAELPDRLCACLARDFMVYSVAVIGGKTRAAHCFDSLSLQAKQNLYSDIPKHSLISSVVHSVPIIIVSQDMTDVMQLLLCMPWLQRFSLSVGMFTADDQRCQKQQRAILSLLHSLRSPDVGLACKYGQEQIWVQLFAGEHKGWERCRHISAAG